MYFKVTTPNRGQGGFIMKKNPCCSMQRSEKKICTWKNMEWESPYIPIMVMGLADISGQCLLDIGMYNENHI